MKRLLCALLLGGALLAGCGGSPGDDACAVNQYGNTLCGSEALAYCKLIDGYSEPAAKQACKEIWRSVYGDKAADALDNLEDELGS